MSAELLALSDIPFIPLAIPQEVAAEKVFLALDYNPIFHTVRGWKTIRSFRENLGKISLVKNPGQVQKVWIFNATGV